jgi:hypothetical protein
VGIHQVSQACLDLLDKIGEWRLATDHEELEKKHRKDLLHTMVWNWYLILHERLKASE